MNMNFGLIISDNNNCSFKSKSMKESHNILGQSVAQWSSCAVVDTVQSIEVISFEELDKCKEILSRAEQVIINWADQPLILAETFTQLLKIQVSEESSATAIFACRGEAAVYIFNCKVLLQKLNELQVQTLSREVLKQVFQSIKNTTKSIYEDKNQFVVVKDRVALAQATAEIQSRINKEIMMSGVTIVDPTSTFIDVNVEIGGDSTILPNTIIQGNTAIGEDCMIGPNSRISNCKIGNNVEIANSVCCDSSIGDETHVGPFAYLRPGSIVGSRVKIGDFVEIKKATIGNRTKISHLTYVGDAEIGENVNMGCGVVVVNYDGKHKNKTVVGDNSFIGCNTNLVSPVVIHKDAYIAAGSTITDDVPEKSLAIARERQTIKQNWVTEKGLERK